MAQDTDMCDMDLRGLLKERIHMTSPVDIEVKRGKGSISTLRL